MEQKNKHRAALYLRLSRDDGAGESASIDSQRKLLLQYAKKNGFSVFDEYVDDGWSGTNFDRPAFLRMIAHIEAGLIQTVGWGGTISRQGSIRSCTFRRRGCASLRYTMAMTPPIQGWIWPPFKT